jgi:predicted RNA binding protein YcfA (HicA-like mRNA interferase family)
MPPKYSDIQKRLEADGWRLKSQKGSHMQYVHPTKIGKVTLLAKPSATPPDGTYLSILRQAGLRK